LSAPVDSDIRGNNSLYQNACQLWECGEIIKTSRYQQNSVHLISLTHAW